MMYRHTQPRLTVPNVSLMYQEVDTGALWAISARIDSAYFVRLQAATTDERAPEEQVFDAELLCRRLMCSLLLGARLYVEFERAGAVRLEGLEMPRAVDVTFGHDGGNEPYDESVIDWFRALSDTKWLERAASDVLLALRVPGENLVFLYRAFEWLKVGLNTDWKNLGAAVDVAQQNINHLKKSANSIRSAGRHAVPSGRKARIGTDVLGGWVQGTCHAIVHARGRIDPAWKSRLETSEDPWPIDEIAAEG